MSRILIVFLAGLLTLILSLTALFLTGSNGGFSDALNQAPFFRDFVEMSENIVNLETGNPVSHSTLIKDILIICVIIISLRLVKFIINWIVKAFVIKKPIDKTINILNKSIWNIIFSMLSIVIVPALVSNAYDDMESKTNTFLSVIVACLFIGVFIVVSMLWGIYTGHQKAGLAFVRTLIIPSVQAVALVSVYSFFYCALKTEYYSLFFTFILCAVIVYFALDFLSDRLMKIKKVNKED